MADDLLVSFAEFEKARDSCFDPVCDTVKSLDTFLNETFTLTDMSLAIFKTTEKALWHVAVVYFTESSYVKLCEELQRWLYAFFRQVGLIFKQIKATGLISSSILLYFVVEVLCSLAKLHGAHCCGMTVKEECLDITYSESNTPELDNEIAAEVQAIYDHIMNTRSDCSVKTHFHEKTNCLEALLGRHDRSWIGFLSAIIQGRHVQTYRFVRDLAPENDIRVCQICMEHLHKAQFPKAKITDHCDHATTACLECLSQFLSAQVGTVTWDRITCPICPSVIGFTEIEKYASVDTSARYQWFMVTETFKHDPEYRQCLRPGCTFGQLHEEGDKGPLLRCGDCCFRMCYVHNIPWHEGQTCSEYTYQLGCGAERNREEEASEAVVVKISKPCPSCESPIEKNQGCDHMTCRKCRHEFC